MIKIYILFKKLVFSRVFTVLTHVFKTEKWLKNVTILKDRKLTFGSSSSSFGEREFPSGFFTLPLLKNH